jgi:hypothetical protein
MAPDTFTTDAGSELNLLLFVIGHNEPSDFMESEDWQEIEDDYPLGATEEQCLPYFRRKIFGAYAARYLPSMSRQ